MTNATINKENIKEDTFKEEGEEPDSAFFKIEGNMYTNYQFESYLQKIAPKLCPDETFANGPFKDKIVPQLQKGVVSSLLACRDSVVQGGKYL